MQAVQQGLAARLAPLNPHAVCLFVPAALRALLPIEQQLLEHSHNFSLVMFPTGYLFNFIFYFLKKGGVSLYSLL